MHKFTQIEKIEPKNSPKKFLKIRIRGGGSFIFALKNSPKISRMKLPHAVEAHGRAIQERSGGTPP
jgi:hypothetical protein